jgi:hypothetical protein
MHRGIDAWKRQERQKIRRLEDWKIGRLATVNYERQKIGGKDETGIFR